MEILLIICNLIAFSIFVFQNFNHNTGKIRAEEISIFALLSIALVNVRLNHYMTAIYTYIICAVFSFILILQDRKRKGSK